MYIKIVEQDGIYRAILGQNSIDIREGKKTIEVCAENIADALRALGDEIELMLEE
jgi:hypothetical protein